MTIPHVDVARHGSPKKLRHLAFTSASCDQVLLLHSFFASRLDQVSAALDAGGYLGVSGADCHRSAKPLKVDMAHK